MQLPKQLQLSIQLTIAPYQSWSSGVVEILQPARSLVNLAKLLFAETPANSTGIIGGLAQGSILLNYAG